MKEQSIIEVGESRPVWESLEALARQEVQRLLQLLEEEVEQALGRARYARRDRVEATPGYQNGSGKPSRLPSLRSPCCAKEGPRRTPGEAPRARRAMTDSRFMISTLDGRQSSCPPSLAFRPGTARFASTPALRDCSLRLGEKIHHRVTLVDRDELVSRQWPGPVDAEDAESPPCQ
jgi:hypothetical protein